MGREGRLGGEEVVEVVGVDEWGGMVDDGFCGVGVLLVVPVLEAECDVEDEAEEGGVPVGRVSLSRGQEGDKLGNGSGGL